MKRIGWIILVLALAVQGVAAQDTTNENPAAQPVAVPTIAAPVQSTGTGSPFSNSEVLSILINARTDLEVLANQQLGSERPVGWSGSLDVSDPQLALLIRLDLELLATRLVGLENMPAGWFGAVPSTPFAIARDIRHDLELLADVTVGPSIRPPGWAGDEPLMRCDRSTQNLVGLLQREGLFTATILPTNPNYCALTAIQVSQYIEVNVLGRANAGPVAAPAAQSSSSGATGSALSGGSDFALSNVGLAYLDRYATKRAGMIPPSESFEPVARSLTQFSRMSLVRGSGFEVFVDYETTTMTEAEFLSLPDVNGFGANPHCDAAWCTPVQVIVGLGSGTTSSGGRALASKGLINAGTNMVIHYDGEDHDGMTKVRMELCDRPTSSGQAICEPAVEVILPDGSASAAVGSVNGLFQFYVPYKYTSTSVRSRNFYTADLWIDPPENR